MHQQTRAPRFRVEYNKNYLEFSWQTQPAGWVVLSRHYTLETAIAEKQRREHQEGRGYDHRVTDLLGKKYN